MKIQFGKTLRWLRTEAGLTQTELCGLLHCSVGCISQWERELTQPSFEMLDKMAKLFGILPGDLLNGIEGVSEYGKK